MDWSGRVHDTPYIVAGNYSLQPTQAIGPVPVDEYNGITVGFTRRKADGDFGQIDETTRNDMNQFGMRRFIDLVAPGRDILVPVLPANGRGTSYDSRSGSSYAAPHVTGAVALLQEYGDQRAAAGAPGWTASRLRHEVMKAVLMNSADKIRNQAVDDMGLGMSKTIIKTNATTWLNSDARDSADNNVFGRDYPLDVELGAGQLNVRRALNQYSSGKIPPPEPGNPAGLRHVGWDYNSIGSAGEIKKYPLALPLRGESYVTLTLTWDRRVDWVDQNGDTFAQSLEFTVDPLPDLDLYLMPKGATSLDQNIWSSNSRVDNVEHIFYQLPPNGGEYEIWVQQVGGTGTNYALAWWSIPAPDPLQLPGRIGSIVWEDQNANGIRDLNEPEIPGVFVHLYEASGAYVATRVTDGYGHYEFQSVAPGDYYVVFEAPDGYTFSPQNMGTDEAIDSDSNLYGQTDVFSIDTNALLTVDTGLFTGQWANSVLDFSSELSSDDGATLQALGDPTTFDYGDSATAWAPNPINGSLEYITVGFNRPAYATGVSIRETFGNGFVYQVDLLDTDDVYHTVWTGTDPSQPGSPAAFIISFPTTSYLVKGVKIYTDTDHDPNAREEIDAVLLHGQSPNASPVATDDIDQTVIGVPITIDVLVNDSDPDNDFLTITEVTQGAHGNVVIFNNTVTYTPDSSFEGEDSFSYTVSDGFGGYATATVFLTVGQAQLAEGGPQAGGAVPLLSEADLRAAVTAALPQLSDALGVSFDRSAFGMIDFRIADLHGGILGITYQHTIWLDRDAAGHGWFLDASSTSDRSFAAAGQRQDRFAHEGSAAAGRMDLLTVVAHELGHILGFASVDARALPHHLMTMTLAAGVRRLAVEPVPGPLTPAVVATPLPPLPAVAASVPSAPLLFGGTEVQAAGFLALDPGWLCDRQTRPVFDAPGSASAGLLYTFAEAATPGLAWLKPLPPLFPAEAEALLPAEATGEELLPSFLWSSDDPAVLVGGDGDDLRIGEEGSDFLLGGFGHEEAETAESAAACPEDLFEDSP
jgi:hypothetical protein